MNLKILLIGALSLAFLPIVAIRAQGSYTLSQVTPQLGEGNWDFLSFDVSNQRFLVPRVGGVEAYNVSGRTPTLFGTIPAAPGILVNAVVPVEQFGFGFTSNGDDGSTTVFDLKTLQFHTTIKLGVQTDAAVFDPVTGDAVFFSPTSEAALVFDFRQLKVVGTIPLGDAAETATVGGNGLVYVNLPDLDKVAVLNVRTLRVVSEASVDLSCQGPMSMANNPSAHLLFIGCSNGVFDEMTEGGQNVATAPIGPVPDQLAFDPTINTVFAGSVNGAISVVRLNTTVGLQVSSVKSQVGARTIAVNPETHIAYSITADFGPPGPDGHPVPFPGTLRLLTFRPPT